MRVVNFFLIGNFTSHTTSIVSRKTAKAPIAPAKEKATTVIAVHKDVKGDVAPASNSRNRAATDGPASEVISCINCWVLEFDRKIEQKNYYN